MTARELHAWNDEAQKLRFTSLASTRKAAVSWLGNISTFTGLLSLAGITFKFDTLGNRAAPWDVLLPGCLILATIGNIVAVILAFLATGGIPRTILNDGSSLRRFTDAEVPKVLTNLAWSRTLTGVVVALLVIVAILSQAIPVTSSPSKILVTTFTGDILCGGVKAEPDGSIRTLVTSSGEVKLPRVAQLTTVTACR